MKRNELKKMEKTAAMEKLPIIGQVRGQILKNVLMENKRRSILEIGTLIGYSAILMAECLSDDGKILTIEKNKKSAEIAHQNIVKAGFDDKVYIAIGRAQEIIPELKEKFDFVFLDATKREYLEYLKLIEPKLTNDAIIVADNVKKFAFLMSDFLQYVKNNSNLETKFFEIGDDAVCVSRIVK